MNLEIDEAQRQELRSLLERRLGEMGSLIHHSDNAQVRQELRDRRDSLRSLLELLEPAAA
ncbi:MAG: hypothetical protein WCD35_02310 [Mycobacteriales bacterium]